METLVNDSFWSGRRVLVTGATGLFGSWLTLELLNRGANVTTLVRDQVPASNFYLMNLDRWCNVVNGSVEDFLLLDRTINEYEVDTVFHLAAQTIVGIANQNPLSTFETNIKGTWSLLEACRRNKRVSKILVSTSDKAYGAQPKLPYDESMPLQGRHPYDVSKSCADLIAQSFHASYGLPVTVIRCANLFGGGDLNFNRLIPGTIQSVLQQERPIIRSDGKFIRDYLYVKDAVLGALTIIEKWDSQKLAGEVFNLGLGMRISALDLVRRIMKAMEAEKLKPIILNQAGNEIRKQYMSSAKAKRRLKWGPAFTFDAALGETIDWYRNFFEQRRLDGPGAA